MFDRDIWAEIFHSIKKNKLRTFLTGFSVAWGIFILVLLLASVNGMKNGFTSQFNDDATNSIYIRTSVTTMAYDGFEAYRAIQFTNRDIEYIKGNFKDEVEYITPRFSNGVTARYKKETGRYPVRAVSPSHQYIEKTLIQSGRFLNDNDINNKLKVVVIGRKIKEDLFEDEDPLGKTLIVNNSTFRIIGVFTDEGNDREERFLYFPVTTMQRLYSNTDKISMILLTYNPKFSFAEAINFSETLEIVLKRRHKIHPDDQGAIYLNNNAEGFSDVTNFTNMLNYISVGVGLLILLAGIIGIGNILVFIIKERTKEIGIRKALGARPAQIINLVILESVFITTISGFGGMLFAMGLIAIVGPNIKSDAFANPSVELSTIIIATVILVVAGVLAGLIPAIKAAKVRPIVALNSD
ncbi:MAG TPA: ABC transporter ATP-binding protein [Flavobacteriaceae bacterium]|jgi:putative ABC transport system permease protein|nr:ABC transporter ATP-binding protein [Flavobacteriaceae bacterium]HBS12619.1 ABC transporter ATP-binding protein [Flavobacteriaceae bacterium]